MTTTRITGAALLALGVLCATLSPQSANAKSELSFGCGLAVCNFTYSAPRDWTFDPRFVGHCPNHVIAEFELPDATPPHVYCTENLRDPSRQDRTSVYCDTGAQLPSTPKPFPVVLKCIQEKTCRTCERPPIEWGN